MTCLLVGLGVPLALTWHVLPFSGTASFYVLKGLLLLPTAMSSSSVAMYLEALGHCFTLPLGEGSHLKCVKVSGPLPLKKEKGKSVPCNKEKVHTKPMDEDKDENEDASGDSK